MTFLLFTMILAGTLIGVLLILFFQGVWSESNEAADGPVLPAFIVLPGLDFPAADSLLDYGPIDKLRLAPVMEPVAKQMLRDRKRLVLRWLALLQKDVVVLWKFRQLLTRCGVATTASEELRITAGAALLVLRITLIRVIVRCVGPFAFTRLLQGLWARSRSTRQYYARLLRLLPLESQIEVEHRWLGTAAS